MKHGDLTGRIIGSAMRVHSFLGSGFPEKIYQKALGIEMSLTNLSYQEEMTMAIYYHETRIGTRRVDFFVEDNIMVELKAVIELNDRTLHKQLIILKLINYQLDY